MFSITVCKHHPEDIMNDESTKPLHTIRDRSLGVSIWERKGRRSPYIEITISRSYFDRETESYGYTSSLREWHLEPLDELLRQARAWIRERSDRAADPPPDPTPETEDTDGRR